MKKFQFALCAVLTLTAASVFADSGSADVTCTVQAVNSGTMSFTCSSQIGTLNINYTPATVFSTTPAGAPAGTPASPTTSVALSGGDQAAIDLDMDPSGAVRAVSVTLTEVPSSGGAGAGGAGGAGGAPSSGGNK